MLDITRLSVLIIKKPDMAQVGIARNAIHSRCAGNCGKIFRLVGVAVLSTNRKPQVLKILKKECAGGERGSTISASPSECHYSLIYHVS